MPTGPNFANHVIAVLNLNKNYPLDGIIITIAQTNIKLFEDLYDKKFGMNGFFKQIYADKITNLIPGSIKLLQNEKKK